MNTAQKQSVRDFWNKAACGEDLYLATITADGYRQHSRYRYELEPEILRFAKFDQSLGKRVLEIGVGLGADHACFAQNGADLTGIDLTERAVEHATRRLDCMGLKSRLMVADAENLPFSDGSFDLVYSWGVLHHSPDTQRCLNEVRRVLKPGGEARIMIYHKYSMVGYMLWIRYALMRLRPFTPLNVIYAKYLESPGTKAYSRAEAAKLFNAFRKADIETYQGHGDLLTSAAGQRHQGMLIRIARLVWPRRLLKLFMPTHGLTMMISAIK